MTPARRLEEAAVISELREGQTQVEVRRLLGTPETSEIGSNGKTLDVFQVIVSKITPATPLEDGVIEVRTVCVIYDKEGRVQRFSYHAGEVRSLSQGLGRWQAGQWVGQEDLKNLQPGITSRSDLIEMLGPATVEGLDVDGYRLMEWLFAEGKRSSLVRGHKLQVILDSDLVTLDYALLDLRPE